MTFLTNLWIHDPDPDLDVHGYCVIQKSHDQLCTVIATVCLWQLVDLTNTLSS